jgi:predicted  nucleic acid-binding Zn-ribbon protein
MYKCVHCSKVYKDTANELLNGCSNKECKSKFFFYVSEEKLREIASLRSAIGGEKVTEELSKTEKTQMEKDVRDITGITNPETPVFLDFESIRIIKPGKYLLDLSKLFAKGKPRVYKLEDGKYIVDLSALKGA